MTKKLVPNEEPVRLARIMNPKVRQWGIDLDALAEQVRQRRARLQATHEEDSEYARLAEEYDRLALELEAQLKQRRKEYLREIEDFRKTQTRDATREFDLNDPKGLWKDLPARVGDDDPRCGPASAQRFQGEDLMAGTRRVALQQQLRAGLEAQMDHKRAVAEAEAEELSDLRATVRALDAIQLELADYEASRRRDHNRQTRDINQALAEEARRRKEAEKEAQRIADEQERAFLTGDPWLNEDRSTTLTAHGTARKDNYKGMSDEERRGILEIQEAQRRALGERKAAEKAEDFEYTRQLNHLVRTLDDMDLKRQQFLRQQRAAAADTLKRQMEEKKERDKRLNETYKNEATAEFFSGFGTSHR